MKALEKYLKGIADVNRLRILNLLLHGELCGCDIQFVMGSSQPNISRHLTYLKNSGWVEDRRDGYRVFYRLAGTAKHPNRQLLESLREIFRRTPEAQVDLKRLKEAIREGRCTVSEFRQYGALEGAAAVSR